MCNLVPGDPTGKHVVHTHADRKNIHTQKVKASEANKKEKGLRPVPVPAPGVERPTVPETPSSSADTENKTSFPLWK